MQKLFLITLIASYALSDKLSDNVNRIKQAIRDTQSEHHNAAYKRMAYFVDTFGPRMWGSAPEHAALLELQRQIEDMGFDNVVMEQLDPFDTWVRGKESLTLLSPRNRPQKLSLIGLGLSEPGDLEAEVVVVRNYAELDAVKDKVKDKIVCYNIPWTNYDDMRTYRSAGPDYAAKYGAKAILLRSIASYSLYSPHTGSTKYGGEVTKIPAAAITVEDSEMFQRMQDRGQKIVVHLVMESSWKANSESYNILAEIKGSKYPDQILLMGGHTDSWDTGSQTGAMDDMGGVTVCLEAAYIIKSLGIQPLRTIRFIAWSGEEMGLPDKGAFQYANKHANDEHVLALENDLGNRQVVGFGFTGKLETSKFIRQLVSAYIPEYGSITENDGEMVDTRPLGEMGVPLMRNRVNDTNDDFYFMYHHSNGDSVTMMNPDEMDSNVEAIATLFYLVADVDSNIPK